MEKLQKFRWKIWMSELRARRLSRCAILIIQCMENRGSLYFRPQKGADDEMVQQLDANLRKFAERIQTEIGKDISNIHGGGAAGAMGAGMVAFFDSKLQMGIETVLDIVKFDELIQGADLIFTGEGKWTARAFVEKW